MTSTISPTRKCGTCGKTRLERALVRYSTELKHDGRTYPIELTDMPAIRCPHCEAISLTEASFARLDLALHEAAQLMPAAEIIERRKALRLQKRQLALALRMAPETITRFERGTRIQSAHYDLMLRLYLASGYVRGLVTAFHSGQDIFRMAQVCENAVATIDPTAPAVFCPSVLWPFITTAASSMNVSAVCTAPCITVPLSGVSPLGAAVPMMESGGFIAARSNRPQYRIAPESRAEPATASGTNSYALAA